MLFAFPATFCADPHPFPAFEPGFPSWENYEPSAHFHLQEEPAVLNPQFSCEPISSNSGSDAQNPVPSSGSDDSHRNGAKTLSSGSNDHESRVNLKKKRSGSARETSRLGCVVEERKRRRMMSNRESARRSRMRKQKHLENLRNQANWLKLGNREQSNRLRLIVYQTELFRRENDCLRTEAAVLRQRLWDIRQVLVVRQLQQLLNSNPMQINNSHSINHNLIT